MSTRTVHIVLIPLAVLTIPVALLVLMLSSGLRSELIARTDSTSSTAIGNQTRQPVNNNSVGVLGHTSPLLTYGGYDVSSATFSGVSEQLNVSAQETALGGFTFSNDGLKVFVVGVDGDSVVEYSLGTAFDISTAVHAGAAEELDVSTEDTEPFTIRFNDDGTKLFMIGNATDSVHEYALSTAFDVSTATYAGAGEAFSVASEESVPRGLAFSDDGLKMFVVGTAGDAVVEYSLATAFDVSTAVHAGVAEELSVLTEDNVATGITFNSNGSKLFVSGVGSSSVIQYSLSTPYDVSTATHDGSAEALSLSSSVTSPYDLAFGDHGNRLYVSDNADNDIAEFAVDSGGNFEESALNDGSIGQGEIVIHLEGDTFQDTDTDDVLDVGSEVVVGNVPVGLVPVMDLSAGDSVVTLTLSGNATSHQNSDDVSDLTFVFDDSAFVGGSAASVTNSGSGSAYSSGVGVNFVDNFGVTINQKSSQNDPTGASPVLYRVVFSDPIDVATFTTADIDTSSSTATGITVSSVTEVSPNNGTTFDVSVDVTGDGDVIATVPGGGVFNSVPLPNAVSTSTDNSITFDTSAPADPTIAPDLTTSSDSGASSTDDLTNITSPTVDVTCAAAGNEITLYTDVPTANTALVTHTCAAVGVEPVALTSVMLTNGVHNLSYTEKDSLGNESGHSPSLALTVDTVAPSAPLVSDPSTGDIVTTTSLSVDVLCSIVGEIITVTSADIVSNPTATTCSIVGTESVPVVLSGTGPMTLGVTMTDATGNESTVSYVTITLASAADTDGDGIDNTVEDAGPNNGDGNGDGTLDSLQPAVVTVPSSMTNAYVTLAVEGTDCQLVDGYSVVSESIADENYDYPFGLHDFTLACGAAGDTANVALFLDTQYDTSSWTWRKLNRTNSEYTSMANDVTYSTAMVGSTSVTKVSFDLQDGGAFDEDGVSNLRIVDPSGPGVEVAGLSETGQAVLSFMLIGGGLIFMAVLVLYLMMRTPALVEVSQGAPTLVADDKNEEHSDGGMNYTPNAVTLPSDGQLHGTAIAVSTVPPFTKKKSVAARRKKSSTRPKSPTTKAKAMSKTKKAAPKKKTVRAKNSSKK